MIYPLPVGKHSPFIGEECALCKEPFAPGDLLVLCPEDATRHHRHCWQANDNHCSALGCEGSGQTAVAAATRTSTDEVAEAEPGRGTEPEPRPGASYGCAQSCLVIAIAASIVIIAFSCFGLWAIADYILIEILGWSYRSPLGVVPFPIFLLI